MNYEVGLGAEIAELSCSVTSALDTLVEYYEESGRASVANPHITHQGSAWRIRHLWVDLLLSFRLENWKPTFSLSVIEVCL